MKKLSVILSCLLVVALLAGCVQTPPADNGDTQSSATQSTTAAQTGPTTIPVAELLSMDEVKAIALKTAGVKEKEIKGLEIDLDYDAKAKRWDYEIDFYVGNVEYELEIDAKSGAVIYYRNDHTDVPTKGTISTTSKTAAPINTTSGAPTTRPTVKKTTAAANKKELISADKAKNIALEKAKTTKDKVSRYRYELDFDDDSKRWEYEIDFYVGKVEYDVTINATDGKVLKFEKETEDDKHKATATTKPKFVDEELVRDYAVLCAGVSEEKIKDYEVELDYNEKSKLWEYEVTFKVGRLEYEITIDAVSGNQISFHKELDD